MTPIVPTEFTQYTPSLIINQFLKQLQNEPENTFTIYPTVLSYPSMSAKRRHIESQATIQGKADYEACNHIQAVKSKLKADGTILWLSGSLFHVGMSGSDNPWHAYIVVYIHRRLVIIDPDYTG